MSRIRIAALSALLPLTFGAAPALAALSPAERQIVSTADAGTESDIALLEKLVAQNSGTRNLDGVRKVNAMVAPEFAALGFETRWVPMDAVGRAGHLIATHKGKRGTTRMLLIGHLDTVFEPGSPFQTARREGTMLHGPGAADDKGGVVVMLAALKAMKAAGTLAGANIEVVLTGDEEAAGEPVSLARADLVAAGKRADVALDFEGLVIVDGQDYGSVARRSAGDYTITASGITAHSSGTFSPEVGDGAVFELARIITAFREELPEPNLTFNIGLVGGGATAALSGDEAQVTATGKTNIIPPVAIAKGDYRALTPEQVERVKARMQAIVARHLPRTDAAIRFKDGYPPMAPTPGNQALLDRLNTINTDLGLKAMPALDPLKRGAGDISFVAQYVDGLAGLGPSSSGDHTPEERVDLSSFPRQIKRAALLMTRLSREPAGR
ncbi:M20/M25/M40 family metallo-hydrolase [Novosphingobium resinovorum]|uniref:Peptidase M20 n=1 Tax=Novosphingobium resinovorum TaxID=158500 RepID=A0A1D8A0U1_9SPHN|nr:MULTISPECIES: M20/M25/M40 family metallo-hydrolase [Novosphingobium]AOR75728.1 peptidase M20 [Novosphingobium resinovorum]MBF7011079.1 M20/M25/M40 family metallo-hydrolase [Novosphingobium sp. HR1a]WJM29068.1 M20/M25/M40 family metallo-hydrolase [Novosphingobium resinovorum]